MSNTTKGLIAGFVATVVLSAVILLKTQLGIAPEHTVLFQLSKLAGGVVGGWMDHFIIGVLVWGMLFAGFDSVMPPSVPYWLKGIIFSMLAWVVAMVVFLPFVGMGFFGMKVGPLPAVLNLVQHLIYGVVLGVTYGLLASWVPAKVPGGKVPT
jgi:hypothetical protein